MYLKVGNIAKYRLSAVTLDNRTLLVNLAVVDLPEFRLLILEANYFVKLSSESKDLSRHWFLAPVFWRVPPHSAVTQQGAGGESKVDQGYLVVAYSTHFPQLRLAEASEGFQNLGHCP